MGGPPASPAAIQPPVPHNPEHGTWAAVVIDVSGTSSALAPQPKPRLDLSSWLQKQRCSQRDVPASRRGRGSGRGALVLPTVSRHRWWTRRGDAALVLDREQPNSYNAHGLEGRGPSRAGGYRRDCRGRAFRTIKTIRKQTQALVLQAQLVQEPAQPTSVPANPGNKCSNKLCNRTQADAPGAASASAQV